MSNATPRKYGNTKIELAGITFDSKREAKRYQELVLMLGAGVISDLRLQPVYELQPAFRDASGKHQRAITYRADFAYVENGKQIAEDVKGMVLEVFKVKAKLFKYKYPDIELRVTK